MERLRLLIADDEEVARRAIAELCASLGHEVVAEARSGRETIELAQVTNPDLLLLDINMPGLTGLEAASDILERGAVPIVIITGHTDESLITDAARIGVFSYLVKPITRERLSAAILTAQARFNDMAELRDEVGGLKRSLEDRKLVERAKGIIMRDMKVGEQEAYRWLKRTSSQSNQRIAEVARRLVALEAQPAGSR